MPEADAIGAAVALARAELVRTIAAEASAFRARLFTAELARLDSAARAFAAAPSRFSRARLAAPLEVIALYTLECVEAWAATDGGLARLDLNESMRRIERVLRAARTLRRAA